MEEPQLLVQRINKSRERKRGHEIVYCGWFDRRNLNARQNLSFISISSVNWISIRLEFLLINQSKMDCFSEAQTNSIYWLNYELSPLCLFNP